MKNIIVCSKIESTNDLINFFSYEWVKALNKLTEVHVKVFEATDIIDNEMIEMLQSKSCSMLCYNNCRIDLYNGCGNIWEQFGVPVYDFLLDHPRNYEQHLKNPIKNLHIICLDRDHAEFVKRFYPEVEDVIFLPDSGVRVCDNILPFSKRSIDVLYCGNCQNGANRIAHVEYLPNNGVDMYDAAIEYMLNDPSLTAEAAVERYLIEKGLSTDKDTLYDLFITRQVSRLIEDIIRREYKLMVMHALDIAGIKVDIYGGGWIDENRPFSENIRIHPRVTPYECHRLIGDAKIDLSLMPWFKRGSSEKPFAGMMNGAVCVSDTSEYLEENYLDGIDMMLFDLDHIEKAVEDIMWLLDNPEEAEIIAQNGYRHAKEYDSTDARVRQIVEIMNKIDNTP